jgi:hypothetical protein
VAGTDACANVSAVRTEFQVHSTRLFPKGSGAEAYRITGIARRCDWVVLSDELPPQTVLVEQRPGISPRHVFLSLRQPFAALEFFHDQVLPRIKGPFRLISGSEDITLPVQRDKRWRAFDTAEQQIIENILADSRLVSWASENLETLSDPRWMPLPLGLTFPDGGGEKPVRIDRCPPQSSRPLRVLCAHRIRQNQQWDLRRQVTRLCRDELSAWISIFEREVSDSVFNHLLRTHAFVICAEGGGLDPSPKAWQALLHGAIPIMRSSGLDGAYRQLPVVIVAEWTREELAFDRLRDWQSTVMPWFDEPQRRAEVLHRLSIDYWWQTINSYGPLQTKVQDHLQHTQLPNNEILP